MWRARRNLIGDMFMSSTLFSILALAKVGAHYQVDPHAESRAREGKDQLDKIVSDPGAQGCWSSAVAALEAGCRSMDDMKRSRLAVQVRMDVTRTRERIMLPEYPCPIHRFGVCRC